MPESEPTWLTKAHAVTQSPDEPDWLAEAAYIQSLATDRYPTLQDTQRVYRVLKAVADGNYIDTAIRLAGFAKQTWYDWKTYAKDGHLAAIAIVDRLEKAEAWAEDEMVNCVRGAAKSGPQFWAAGMTYLERRQPDKWGKRQDEGQAPKVVVQIGIRDGDVQVQLGPSPVVPPRDSETPLILEQNPAVSDKVGYVNHAKLLTGQTIEGQARRRGEGKQQAKGASRRGKQ